MNPTDRSAILIRRIRILLAGLILGLVVSGLTAFPLPAEVELLAEMTGRSGWLGQWITHVLEGLRATESTYPFLFYGTDWLAFGHLVIAVAFIGPIRDPVRNVWVVQWGIIACIGVIPLALICGPIRGIPFGWCLIDCSFGLLGLIPLTISLRAIHELESSTAL